MGNEIDITDSDGSDRDIATDYRDDVGVHCWYITWWGSTYPGAIFPADYPRGNTRSWRQTGDEEEPDASEEGMDDQADEEGQQDIGGDEDDPDIGEEDQDGDDKEDEEDEDEDEENEEEDGDEQEVEDEKDEEDEEIKEEAEEAELDVVPHHSEDDTIELCPPSLSLQAEKDPVKGPNSSPH